MIDDEDDGDGDDDDDLRTLQRRTEDETRLKSPLSDGSLLK